MQAAIRLFKAIPVDVGTDPESGWNAQLDGLTVPKGFVFDRTAAAELLHRHPQVPHVIEAVETAFGRDPEKLNQAFHKSFRKVKEASIEQLVIEQVVHYFTTYGAEALGVYDEGRVFVPAEKLDVPEIKEDLPLVVIRGLTQQELKAELLTLLSSGIALDEQSVQDAVEVAGLVTFTGEDLSKVANKEVVAALYRGLDTYPQDPVEFLRYLVYLTTGKTLLIKNPAAIAEIKAGATDNNELWQALRRFDAGVGVHRLAEIFHRFKPIFLALRVNPNLKYAINRVRRMANRHHKPMKADLLNDLTATLARGEHPANDEFVRALLSANTFRLIRLAYALQFRATENESVVYRIRNGKSFATGFSYAAPQDAASYLAEVLGEIRSRIAHNVRGKTVYIPEGVNYALPSSQKQFTGNVPSGTSVEVESDFVAGVHWTNTSGRVDLDLSLLDSTGRKIGWDSFYRDTDKGIYFTGDQTDAPKPNGATEAFSIGSGIRGAHLLMLNLFSGPGTEPVPFNIFAASENRFGRDYIVDPNKVVAYAKSEISSEARQKILGVIVADNDSTRFYFGESNQGVGRSSRFSESLQHSLNYLISSNTDSISLNGLLHEAGAEITDELTDDVDIDLSIEAVDKNSFVNLLT